LGKNTKFLKLWDGGEKLANFSRFSPETGVDRIDADYLK